MAWSICCVAARPNGRVVKALYTYIREAKAIIRAKHITVSTQRGELHRLEFWEEKGVWLKIYNIRLAKMFWRSS